MARYVHAGAAALAALAVAACSTDMVSPPQSEVLGVPTGLRTSAPEQVVPGEVIVALNAGVSPGEVAATNGVQAVASGWRGSFTIMRTSEGGERAMARQLAKDPRVRYAEPNYLRQPTTIDSRLWAFYNPGGLNMLYSSGANKGKPLSSSYASIADADEDNIEGYAAGGADVVVGSIDTGVDFTHPEFKNADGTSRLIAGTDWYANDNDPSDTDGHGTHTTGTMIGNTVGIAGVSGAGAHVKVYVQRVCGQRGCPTSAIVSAIRAAADFGVVAMNMSLGGASESQAEKDAIAYATSKNAIVIASAGNDGTTTVSCPACDANAISVAATTWADKLAPYSNQGAGLDISAPGGSCYSNTT
ncbi:MAG TPA: S8 family serine peptidase, partial [Gemmatimonadaceae bacterium]|nr:S8 family serine peptidase [Gemmatimonadaceae bacterium]